MLNGGFSPNRPPSDFRWGTPPDPARVPLMKVINKAIRAFVAAPTNGWNQIWVWCPVSKALSI